VLGPAHDEGNEMCQWILKANGKVVPRRSMRPLTIAEIHSPTELKRQQVFNKLIERRWGTSINPPKPQAEDDEHEFENYKDDDAPMKHVPDIEDIEDSNNNLIEQQPVYDKLSTG
jgi:hypothetical protein